MRSTPFLVLTLVLLVLVTSCVRRDRPVSVSPDPPPPGLAPLLQDLDQLSTYLPPTIDRIEALSPHYSYVLSHYERRLYGRTFFPGRVAILRSLGRLGVPLEKRLEIYQRVFRYDGSLTVRREVKNQLVRLSRWRPDLVVETLVELFPTAGDPTPVYGRDLYFSRRRYEVSSGEVAKTLASSAPRTRPFILSHLSSADSEVLAGVISTLGEMNDLSPDLARKIATFAFHPSPLVLTRAVKALVRVGTHRKEKPTDEEFERNLIAAQTLAPLLDRADSYSVRMVAVLALAKLRPLPLSPHYLIEIHDRLPEESEAQLELRKILAR